MVSVLGGWICSGESVSVWSAVSFSLVSIVMLLCHSVSCCFLRPPTAEQIQTLGLQQADNPEAGVVPGEQPMPMEDIVPPVEHPAPPQAEQAQPPVAPAGGVAPEIQAMMEAISRMAGDIARQQEMIQNQQQEAQRQAAIAAEASRQQQAIIVQHQEVARKATQDRVSQERRFERELQQIEQRHAQRAAREERKRAEKSKAKEQPSSSSSSKEKPRVTDRRDRSPIQLHQLDETVARHEEGVKSASSLSVPSKPFGVNREQFGGLVG